MAWLPDISRSRRPALWLAGVFVAGTLLTLLAFRAVRGWQQADAARQATEIARIQAENLRLSVLRSMEVLHSVAALHAIEGHITRPVFREFVRPALARQPELQALSWNPIVTESQRAAFEAEVAAGGQADFDLHDRDASGRPIQAASRDEHVPVCWIEPYERNAAVVGFDLNSDPARRRSLERARDTGQLVATAPLHLAQAESGTDGAGFLVVLPVYHRGASPAATPERRRELAGYAVAVFRMAALVQTTLAELRHQGIDASLSDESPDGGTISGPARSGPGGTIPLEVANRRWNLAFAPTGEFLRKPFRWPAWGVLAGGLAFTLLTTAYLYGGWRQGVDLARANAALQQEVSVRKRAETEAAGASRAKSEFLASMSHEIRTPLNAILGYTQILHRDSGLTAEQRDSLSGIASSGQHLLGLINEILDLAKIEAGRMELVPAPFDPVALGRGLEATFKPLCARKRIGFRLELPAKAGAWVRGDVGKLRQVLINLAGNAVKFTSAGEVVVRFSTPGTDEWEFEVMDTGLGIPLTEQDDIFRPFHQGSGAQHLGGTGLGLTIAQRQVELLGGRLQVQSDRGAGSRFHFRIPLPCAAPAPAPQRPVRRLARGHRVRALVVDDRRENREVLGGLLAGIGCEVRTAADGPGTLEQLAHEPPDIVFLDLLLPGMPGLEVLRRLKPPGGAPAGPPVVAHTASALPALREAALAAGCADFITKPIAEDRLFECLASHLGVELEFQEPSREAAGLPSLEGLRVSVPEELGARLAVAAELHSTTVLKAALQELRHVGPEACALAEHIRSHIRSFDMDGIQRLLAAHLAPAPAGPSANLTPHAGQPS